MPEGAKDGDLVTVPDDLHVPDHLPTLAVALKEAIRLHGDDEVMLHMYVSFFLLPLYEPSKKVIFPISDELD